MNLDENSVTQNLVSFHNKGAVQQRNTYTLLYKQTALKQLEINEALGIKFAIKKTSDETNVDYYLLQRWAKDRLKILSCVSKPSNRRISVGPALKYPDIEIHVKFWVNAMRDLYLAVTCPMIVCEILTMFPNRFLTFSMCEKWVYNVLARLKLSVRAKTHDQGQLDEAEMGEIHLDFLVHFERLQTFLHIPPRLIVNMDETGCYFNMTSKKTITNRGKHD